MTDSQDTASEQTSRVVTRMLTLMFPHPSLPTGPYERAAASIVGEGAEDLRWQAQAQQGAAALDALGDGSFLDLADEPAQQLLANIRETEFFETVRAKAILTLYNDPEVWQRFGYEGPSFDQGGYLHRGFDDLDWLPNPRIEEMA